DGAFGEGVEAEDGFAGFVVVGVAAGGEDDAHGGALFPSGLDVVEGAVEGSQEQLEKVGIELVEEDLGFRVSEAAIEFEHLGTLLGEDESGEEHAPIGDSVLPDA
ncbi:MAG: hypothetical protein RLZZ142_1133, partial [Verrucomicrobiota bacterium]